MKHFILAFWVAVMAAGQGMAVEEIAHQVVRQDGDIEIRDYAETVVVQMTLTGTRRDAPSDAFRPLFNFIQGSNAAAQKIDMTAPVSQKAPDPGENDVWSVRFHMPADMRLKDTPPPADPRLSVHLIPAQRMAAIRFSGLMRDANIDKHEQKLRDYLTANNIAFEDDPIYAFYNGPLTPWFLRHNEVLFALK